MNYKLLVGFLLISLFILHCSKEEESITRIPEAQNIQVELPVTDWQKSMSIASLDCNTSSGFSDPIFKKWIFNELSRISNLRVQKQSTDQADYHLKACFQKVEDGWVSEVRVEEAATDRLIYKKKMNFQEQDITDALFIDEDSLAQALGLQILKEESVSSIVIGSELRAMYHEAVFLLDENKYISTNRAVQLFKEILRREPDYALAAVGLVHSYQQVIHNDWDKNVAFIQLAQDAALKAVEMDPFLAEAHEALADVYVLRHKMKEAEKSYLKAVELNSNLSDSWDGLALIYSHYGLYEPAQSAYEKVILLDPDNYKARLSNALIYISLGEYLKARNELKRILESYPHFNFVYTFIGLIDFYESNWSAAKESVLKGMDSEEYVTLSHAVVAMIYAKEGNFDKALSELELEVKPYVKTDASLAVSVAAIYALIGQKGNAVTWLQKAFDWGYSEYPWLKNDPNLSSMKGDDRFDALMQDFLNRWQEKQLAYLMD